MITKPRPVIGNEESRAAQKHIIRGYIWIRERNGYYPIKGNTPVTIGSADYANIRLSKARPLHCSLTATDQGENLSGLPRSIIVIRLEEEFIVSAQSKLNHLDVFFIEGHTLSFSKTGPTTPTSPNNKKSSPSRLDLVTSLDEKHRTRLRGYHIIISPDCMHRTEMEGWVYTMGGVVHETAGGFTQHLMKHDGNKSHHIMLSSRELPEISLSMMIAIGLGVPIVKLQWMNVVEMKQEYDTSPHLTLSDTRGKLKLNQPLCRIDMSCLNRHQLILNVENRLKSDWTTLLSVLKIESNGDENIDDVTRIVDGDIIDRTKFYELMILCGQYQAVTRSIDSPDGLPFPFLPTTSLEYMSIAPAILTNSTDRHSHTIASLLVEERGQTSKAYLKTLPEGSFTSGFAAGLFVFLYTSRTIRIFLRITIESLAKWSKHVQALLSSIPTVESEGEELGMKKVVVVAVKDYHRIVWKPQPGEKVKSGIDFIQHGVDIRKVPLASKKRRK
ncbi:hypothetical protein PROFUN_06275 [Planoprotostelium fungivorum]|uniref:BRCT domain-containing protein n=1 Tax=Planoprotostelium fungivorum TaxID=1890364 RepID=A0A2P6NE72_9EUKA|nr:hypothetical protein PROFUN_06275 [Planoprotostelium fungivorum]